MSGCSSESAVKAGERANAFCSISTNMQYVRPVMEYGNAGVADAAKSHLALLQRGQNSALRTSLRVPRRTRIAKLHKLARMEPIPRRLRSLQSRAVTRFGANPLMESLRIQQGLLGKCLTTDQVRQPN